MKHWLLIDTNFLCWRAFHAFGEGLSYKGVSTGMLFGVFRDILFLHERFDTDGFVFCFDSRYSRRKELCSTYKANRKSVSEEETEEKRQARRLFYSQVKMLRTRLLPSIGFCNVLVQRGYEADDLIAACADAVPSTDIGTIVSCDQDLFQLLSQNISIWNPQTRRVLTSRDFVNKWGIGACRWAEVKAIAGCSSDNVEGLRGIGEKTAVEWVCGRLKPGSAKYNTISEGLETITRNLRLTTLPFPGVEKPELQTNMISARAWNKVMREFGMMELRDTMPKRRRIGVEQRPQWRRRKGQHYTKKKKVIRG